jgi:alpha-D-ribose 1-methylphosphonate 5-triphosphate synthase subunit PhnH
MTLSPGFADPVLDSQACFRAVLDAMARPGTIHTVDAPHEPPAPLDRATAAVLLTLVDADTPLWFDQTAAHAAPWIAFHCGAPIAPLPGAVFALALAPLPLAQLNPGSDEAPETSATLIKQVAALGSGTRLRLSGPGLAAPTTMHVEGLAPGFVAEWADNHARFPRGIDLILCAGDRLAAFPRTLMIQEA